jgi:hypothetical protein
MTTRLAGRERIFLEAAHERSFVGRKMMETKNVEAGPYVLCPGRSEQKNAFEE